MSDDGQAGRRSFLRRIVGGGAAAGAMGLVVGCAAAQTAPGRTDHDAGAAGPDPAAKKRDCRPVVTDGDASDRMTSPPRRPPMQIDSDDYDRPACRNPLAPEPDTPADGVTDADVSDPAGRGRGTGAGRTDPG